MTRVAHYVASTHWDREWYEPYQGFRMRLVRVIDQVLDTMARDAAFASFDLDGQAIPILDYLEVRPERKDEIIGLVRQGRVRLGPWFVLPDEFLVNGESLVRNLQLGMAVARDFGGEPSRAGFLCDLFGHTGQMPQILIQAGMNAAYVWRGTDLDPTQGVFSWVGADGSAIPTTRFGSIGYCTYFIKVRGGWDQPLPADAVDRLVAHALAEAARFAGGPILLFDGCDHRGIEPATATLIDAANQRLGDHGIRIEHSHLDRYGDELIRHRSHVRDERPSTLTGELRRSGLHANAIDQQWVIPGVLSSRIPLKQANAACEDELCRWAEPFSAFVQDVGADPAFFDGRTPASYLRLAWRHLLENHAHDSICGCSIDGVHRDMAYRFDQSLGISSRIAQQALTAIAMQAAPRGLAAPVFALTVFNADVEAIDEVINLDLPLPTDWPMRWQEFFGYEEKFAVRLRGPDGAEVPYQLIHQARDRRGWTPQPGDYSRQRHVLSVAARLRIPACGYAVLTVEPAPPPTRHLGSLMASHRVIDNGVLRVTANANGSIRLDDLRSGASFDQLLTLEQRADIGDGWYHGVAVNDGIATSAAAHAEVAVVADGFAQATLRIALTMLVPDGFDFRTMQRSTSLTPLRVAIDVTLRAGSDRLEVGLTVHNTMRDHRLRALFPTGLKATTYSADAAFDVVERPIGLPADNAIRRELDLETRPQQTWTAVSDGRVGLAVVSRGLPESAVIDRADRPIALTLLRAFRRAVASNDNPGGQIQGTHVFRCAVLPFAGAIPRTRLCRLGQRIAQPPRTVLLDPAQIPAGVAGLPPSHGFLAVDGDAVVTAVLPIADALGNALMVRCFNPKDHAADVVLSFPMQVASAASLTLDGADDGTVAVRTDGIRVIARLPAKRIATLSIRYAVT